MVSLSFWLALSKFLERRPPFATLLPSYTLWTIYQGKLLFFFFFPQRSHVPVKEKSKSEEIQMIPSELAHSEAFKVALTFLRTGVSIRTVPGTFYRNCQQEYKPFNQA